MKNINVDHIMGSPQKNFFFDFFPIKFFKLVGLKPFAGLTDAIFLELNLSPIVISLIQIKIFYFYKNFSQI